MIVTIASGKGGTGKTSIAVNMALSLESAQLLDCDIEEPNAHLLLHPKLNRTQPVYTTIPKIQEQQCDHCGECAKFCHFNALFATKEKILTFPELCHSCGGCAIVCPKESQADHKGFFVVEADSPATATNFFGPMTVQVREVVPFSEVAKTL